MKRVSICIVVSKEDPASVNIGRALLDMGSWEEVGDFSGFKAYADREKLLVHIKDVHIYHDNVDLEIEDELGYKPAGIVFASRHSSKRKIPSLTVHPIGNFSINELGGRANTLVPSLPELMATALRGIYSYSVDKKYRISYEATHHGPFLQTPSMFIEIGSDSLEWMDERAAEWIARAILSLDKSLPETEIAIGVSSGHYCPEITDLVRSKGDICFGHILPSYQLQNYDSAILKSMLDGTEGARYIYISKKVRARMSEKIEEIEKDSEDLELSIRYC